MGASCSRYGRRFDREAKPEVKPATTRVRKAPKVQAAPAPETVAEVEEAQVEAPQVEEAQVEAPQVEETAAEKTEENEPTEEQKAESQGEAEEPENSTEPAETEPQKATSSNL